MPTAIFDTHGGDSKWNERTGQTVQVLRPLEVGKEIDPEVGKMYKIRFADGVETDAFEDELTFVGGLKYPISFPEK